MMTPEEYEKWSLLGNEVKVTLSEAFKTGNPASDIAQKVAELHKRWLTFTRFKTFYDAEVPGMAEFLRDAIHIYTGLKK